MMPITYAKHITLHNPLVLAVSLRLGNLLQMRALSQEKEILHLPKVLQLGSSRDLGFSISYSKFYVLASIPL